MSLWVDRRGLLILLSDKHGSGQEGQPRELTSWVIIEMKKETNVQIESYRKPHVSGWILLLLFFFCKISVIGVVIF